MSETALDRVSRALNLIPFISKNPGLSVVQIAQRFHSTPTQISKDLSLLHMCGLPGYSHLELLDIDYQDPEYVSVTDPQVLDQPRSLTQLEAMTLQLGLQLLAELATDATERSAISTLQKRITSLLGDQITSKITITDAVQESAHVIEISKAIGAHQILTVEYNSASSDLVTSREIFPLSLTFHDGIAYLQAIAISERDSRTFRVDRIARITPGDINHDFAINFAFSPSQTIAEEIVVELGADGLFFMEKHNEIVTSFTELGLSYRITLRVSPGEWIARTLLSWPTPVLVIQPRELADLLQRRIAGTLANYQ